MAIDRIQGSGAPRPTERASGSPAAEPMRPGVDGDSLQLSPEALERARLARAAGDQPDIREEKIAELRQALADGTYEVDPRQLARALVEFERDLES